MSPAPLILPVPAGARLHERTNGKKQSCLSPSPLAINGEGAGG